MSNEENAIGGDELGLSASEAQMLLAEYEAAAEARSQLVSEGVAKPRRSEIDARARDILIAKKLSDQGHNPETVQGVVEYRRDKRWNEASRKRSQRAQKAASSGRPRRSSIAHLDGMRNVAAEVGISLRTTRRGIDEFRLVSSKLGEGTYQSLLSALKSLREMTAFCQLLRNPIWKQQAVRIYEEAVAGNLKKEESAVATLARLKSGLPDDEAKVVARLAKVMKQLRAIADQMAAVSHKEAAEVDWVHEQTAEIVARMQRRDN